MTQKTIKSRIVHKHDTAENWSKATTFIPKQGEIIVYDRDENYTYERFKIGDGITNVNDLPFANEGITDDYIKKTDAAGYNDILTKTEAQSTYQSKGEYYSKSEVDAVIEEAKTDASNTAIVVLAEAQSDASNKAAVVLAEAQSGIAAEKLRAEGIESGLRADIDTIMSNLATEETALILSSPNGTRYQITVDDSGNLTTAAITA